MPRNIYEHRSWMYAHKDSSGRVTEEFLNGAEMFMYHAGQTSLTLETELYPRAHSGRAGRFRATCG
ncbi:hypothetical protein F2Q70_00021460 [Brassica cretica]|uniref:Uncharacterized protein n=1 Tax=Brassica cretica TaxID=69181 RepID=A0A8S9GWV0_BRACR|nr:hypothetical protein F2Q70_00021460 [Brassica cretica]